MELELSLATEADIPAVAEFCNQHRGRWLPVPDDAEFRQAISDGYLFMAAEAGRRAGPDTVHAVAGTFTCGERAGRGGRRILVHELASMVVDGELGGLHPIPMQQLMLTLRIVALALALAEDTCLLVSVAGGLLTTSLPLAPRRSMPRDGCKPSAAAGALPARSVPSRISLLLRNASSQVSHA